MLRWFHHELAAMAVCMMNGDQLGRPHPRLIRGGTDLDLRAILVWLARHSAGRGFKVLPLLSGYVFMFPFVLIVEFLSVTNLRLCSSG